MCVCVCVREREREREKGCSKECTTAWVGCLPLPRFTPIPIPATESVSDANFDKEPRLSVPDATVFRNLFAF